MVLNYEIMDLSPFERDSIPKLRLICEELGLKNSRNLDIGAKGNNMVLKVFNRASLFSTDKRSDVNSVYINGEHYVIRRL